jgi:hypothetical protein
MITSMFVDIVLIIEVSGQDAGRGDVGRTVPCADLPYGS